MESKHVADLESDFSTRLSALTNRPGGVNLIPGRPSPPANTRWPRVCQSGLPADHVEQQDGGALEEERRGFKCRQ